MLHRIKRPNHDISDLSDNIVNFSKKLKISHTNYIKRRANNINITNINNSEIIKIKKELHKFKTTVDAKINILNNKLSNLEKRIVIINKNINIIRNHPNRILYPVYNYQSTYIT